LSSLHVEEEGSQIEESEESVGIFQNIKIKNTLLL
jgi:hypothetical protein